MYSRKSIRAYQPMTRYLPSETEETDVKLTPPPDYTGVAFYSRQEADYPETVISQEGEEVESAAEPALESLPPRPLDTHPSPVSEDICDSSPTEESPPLQESPAAEQESPLLPPLLTPAWLRTLTIEDILLFWLILQLLSGEPEDQIYLLLGLLLFAGR